MSPQSYDNRPHAMTRDTPTSSRTLIIALVSLLVIVIGGVSGVKTLVRHERQRDLDAWELTLNVMADTRAEQIQRWVASQFTVLNELAGNGSLQIYTQQLQQDRPTGGEIEPAQLSYLRNLILDTAQRTGFVASEGINRTIPANVASLADAGLALVAKDLTVMCATPGMPAVSAELGQSLHSVLASGAPGIHDIAMDSQGRPVLTFLTPVFAALPQPDSGGGKTPIAVLVGMKNAAKSLFPLLDSSSATTATDEAILVRRDNNLVVYVSPLADGSPALAKSQPIDAANLAAALAVRTPGAFNQAQNYVGAEVMATSRTLAGLPWTLLQTITTDEALRESARHQRSLTLAMLLSLSLAASLLVAAWFYGGKVKGQQEAAQLLAQSQRLTAQTHLLSAINDNISDYLFLVNSEGQIIFINQASATVLNITPHDAYGKTLANTLGRIPAAELMRTTESALASSQPVVKEMPIELNGHNLQCHATAIAFPYASANNDTVLISLHDVTESNEARKKKERLLTQIVQALMRAIDLHDPYSANHSANTTALAMAMAQRLGLPPASLQVIEQAASLCNIGKLFIPAELLAKTATLSEEELLMLRKEPDFAGKILGGIEFDGQVLTTILQKNEHLDGSGHPAGLRGEAIITSARVLAVANAFVAMISPRAYRDTLPAQEAMANLLATAGTRYDRQVVAALFQVAENEIDWTRWPKRG